MADRAARALSFGSVAWDYDRLRPTAAPEAVDWLLPTGCDTAVDLAAGTGLFTRALVGRCRQVIAVEPDDRMRDVLHSRSPGVTALAGVGEAIPLPDASADALFVSSAWHWMDPVRAVPEVARVLRPGGRFGVLWTSRDRAVAWVAELDELEVEGADPDQFRPRPGGREVVTPGGEFAKAERADFAFTRRMSVHDVVGMLATYSGTITLTQERRSQRLARVAAAVRERAEGELVDVPMRSWCWRADKP